MKKDDVPFPVLHPRRSVAVLVFPFLALSGTGSGPAAADARWDQVDRISRAAVASGDFSGISIAVTGKDGSFVRGYGQADRERGRAVDPGNTFHIASVSKLFTALAVLELAESGALGLDDEASLWLTELRPAGWQGVTIRRLLSQTAGIPDYTEAEFEKIRSGAVDPNGAWALQRVAGMRLEFPPGEQWRYSSAGYNLLTLIVERASGERYGSFLTSRIARPMKLSSVRLCSDEPTGTRTTNGYVVTDGGYEPNPLWRLAGLKGEGGICATAGDLARLPGALGGLLDEPSRRVLTAPTRLNNGLQLDYGLGVRRGGIEGVQLWGHTGSVGGPVAVIAHFPERELTVAVLANTVGGSQEAGGLFEQIARAALEAAGTPILVPVRLPPDAARRYSGEYQEGQRRIRIGVENGTVMRSVVGSDKPAVPLTHLGDDVFGRADYPSDRIGFGVLAGRTEGVSHYYDGLFSDYVPRVDAAQ